MDNGRSRAWENCWDGWGKQIGKWVTMTGASQGGEVKQESNLSIGCQAFYKFKYIDTTASLFRNISKHKPCQTFQCLCSEGMRVGMTLILVGTQHKPKTLVQVAPGWQEAHTLLTALNGFFYPFQPFFNLKQEITLFIKGTVDDSLRSGSSSRPHFSIYNE